MYARKMIGELSALCCFFFQAEDGIRELVRSRGLGDVYKRQVESTEVRRPARDRRPRHEHGRAAVLGSEGRTGISLSLIHI